MSKFEQTKHKAAVLLANHRVAVSKGFNGERRGFIKEAMSLGDIGKLYPNVGDKLRDGVVTSNTITFKVDLSPFSSFVEEATPAQIRVILDDYYTWAVKCIQAQGGVVEKYIGDAVIAVFGEPFHEDYALSLSKAWRTAEALINRARTEYVGEMGAKCALASGPCFLGTLGPEEHPDLTIVGNPLTELFRLEDAAQKDQFVLPADSFRSLTEGRELRVVRGPATWTHTEESINVRGRSKPLDIVRLVRNWDYA